MPKRSAGATISQVFLEFGRQSTWSQVELAARCGIEVRALKVRLRELVAAGVPLVRDEDPPHVYWSVPKAWRAGAVALSTDELVLVARLLRRLQPSRSRGTALAAVSQALRVTPAGGALESFRVEPTDDVNLAVVEDALEQKHALRMEYFSASRGVTEWRSATVHHIEPGPPARFLATCHKDGAIKWYRVDRVLGARESTGEPARVAAPEQVERILQTTVDGYQGDGASVAVSVFVREPESRWVARNHPTVLATEEVAGGVRLRGEVGSVKQLARWVVTLGGAARPETPELAEAVRSLARAALEAAGS